MRSKRTLPSVLRWLLPSRPHALDGVSSALAITEWMPCRVAQPRRPTQQRGLQHRKDRDNQDDTGPISERSVICATVERTADEQ